MFENDICLCGNNQNCPKREKCARVTDKPGMIYTISLLYDPNIKECEYFINKEE